MEQPPLASPYASIRELHVIEAKLLTELKAMEDRLTNKMDSEHHLLREAIAASDRVHHEVHEGMRTRAEDRHRRIDDWMKLETGEGYKASGRAEAYRNVLSGLRLLNEFRWLIALIVFLFLLSNNVGIAIEVLP